MGFLPGTGLVSSHVEQVVADPSFHAQACVPLHLMDQQSMLSSAAVEIDGIAMLTGSPPV